MIYGQTVPARLKLSSESLSAGAQHLDRSSDVSDVLSDIAELKYLLKDLDQLEPAIEVIKSAKARCIANENLIREALWSTDSDTLASALQSTRREYLSIKSALRTAFRLKGVRLCTNDWEAPWHDDPSPAIVSRNRLHKEINEDTWNYKREGHLDAFGYERLFVSEYLSHLGSDRLKAYLTTCGVASFSTVAYWLAKIVNLKTIPVVVAPIYCETLQLIRRYFPDHTESQPKCTSELVSLLRAQQPSVVFVDAVTNSDVARANDIQAIIGWARKEVQHELFIVIDTTCLPSPLLCSGFLQDLPEYVTVILVESLAKLHQFGMDVVTGGITVLSARDELHNSFKRARAGIGTNITDVSASTLPSPNQEAFTRRIQRLSRNVHMLAARLNNSIEGNHSSGLIDSVSWVRGGTPTLDVYHGPYLVILLREPYVTLNHYRQFEQITLQIARQRRFPIGRGQSFGYDITRLYAPVGLSDKFLLRLAVGNETVSEIETLSEILIQAAENLEKEHSTLRCA